MKWLVFLFALILVVLHQDFWNWTRIAPLLFAVLPVGLWYHGLFAVACAVLMFLLVQTAWPKHLENVQPDPSAKPRDQELH